MEKLLILAPGPTWPCCERSNSTATITSKPSKETQTIICTHSGTPRRGVLVVLSVIKFSINELAKSKIESQFLFFNSSSRRATYSSFNASSFDPETAEADTGLVQLLK